VNGASMPQAAFGNLLVLFWLTQKKERNSMVCLKRSRQESCIEYYPIWGPWSNPVDARRRRAKALRRVKPSASSPSPHTHAFPSLHSEIPVLSCPRSVARGRNLATAPRKVGAVGTHLKCQLQRTEGEQGALPRNVLEVTGSTGTNTDVDGESAVGGLEGVGGGGGGGGGLEKLLLQSVGASGIFMFFWVFVLFPGQFVHACVLCVCVRVCLFMCVRTRVLTLTFFWCVLILYPCILMCIPPSLIHIHTRRLLQPIPLILSFSRAVSHRDLQIEAEARGSLFPRFRKKRQSDRSLCRHFSAKRPMGFSFDRKNRFRK